MQRGVNFRRERAYFDFIQTGGRLRRRIRGLQHYAMHIKFMVSFD
jgi:hypothetical protein